MPDQLPASQHQITYLPTAILPWASPRLVALLSSSMMNSLGLKILLTILVLIHLIGNLWHGNAHTTLDIALPAIKTAFVIVVILLGPVLGAILTWTNFAVLGSWIIGFSMVGSVLFSVYHHFILISNDNIEHLPAGTAAAQAHFADSAEFIALAAFIAALVAFYVAGRLQAENSDVA